MKYRYIIILLLTLNFISMTSVSALSVVVHVPEKYTDVIAGERFYFEIEVKYPENPSRKDLRLNYEISKNEEIVAQSKTLKAIENQASFIDFIVIPKSATPGMHIINVKIKDYKDLSEEVSASFHIISENSDKVKIYFFILLGTVILVGILVAVNIMKNKE